MDAAAAPHGEHARDGPRTGLPGSGTRDTGTAPLGARAGRIIPGGVIPGRVRAPASRVSRAD